MKKVISLISLAALLVASIPVLAFAQQQLTRFAVTIDQLDISRDGGRTWLTIHSGAKQFDLVALSGGNAGAWSSVVIPAGTYNRWRVHTTTYSATVTGHNQWGTVNAAGTVPANAAWDEGNMNVVVESDGTTSATFNFDAETSYTVMGPNDISLDPQITVQ